MDSKYGLRNDLIHRDTEKYFESYDGLEKITRLTNKNKPVNLSGRVLRSLKNRD